MNTWLTNRFLGMAAVITIALACQPAAYELVGKKKKTSVPGETQATPVPSPTAAPGPVQPPFTVSATPNPADINTPITFAANGCGPSNAGSIKWNMGNGDTREGPQFSYTYTREGTYTVTAVCDDGSKATINTAIVVTIMTPVPAGPGGGQNQSPIQRQFGK